MNQYTQDFQEFTKAFAIGDETKVVYALNNCFMANPKATLSKLYERQFLFNRKFLNRDFSEIKMPEEYQLLFGILQTISVKLKDVLFAFRGYSLEQVLQGAANLLEKDNAELKYNAAWNIKHAGANEMELEGERQAFYFSRAGIELDEILKNMYKDLEICNRIEISWDEKESNKFKSLFHEFGLYNEIRDAVEKHLFFNWAFEAIGEKGLKMIPPVHQREGRVETDYLHSLKSKIAFEELDKSAHQNLAYGYLEKVKSAPKLKEFWRFFPEDKNEQDMQWFAEAIMMDIEADLTVERELALYKNRYFPDIEQFEFIELAGGEQLSLRDTLRVLAFISELSKQHIRKADAAYLNGVNHYSSIYPPTKDEMEIDRKSKLFMGDPDALRKMLDEHYSEEVFEKQQRIINGAKNTIKNENCLVKFDYDKLVKAMQWIHQYEVDFIAKVVGLFMYDPNRKTGITRTPFFRIREDLCWMPNLVAYASFMESLIENLLSRELISIHKLQTDYYEESLNRAFERCGYSIITKKEHKLMKDETGKVIGDFDLLAYKKGHVIHLELKLTHSRNSYYERYIWRKDKLVRAAEQLKTGLEFIQENPDHIRKILGLKDSDAIVAINQFIISNSYLYDHENINGYLKMSYFEVMTMLKLMTAAEKSSGDFVKALANNKLFKELEDGPKLHPYVRVEIGNYSITRPGMLLKNVNASL